MKPTATKRKSPDDQSQVEQNVKRVKLDISDMPNEQDEQVPEEVEQVAKLHPSPTKPEVKKPKINKLTPPRPFPIVPPSVSATGPRSAHSEGKNCICITRRTPLAAYLRRCKDAVLEDGWAVFFFAILVVTSNFCQGTKLCT